MRVKKITIVDKGDDRTETFVDGSKVGTELNNIDTITLVTGMIREQA